MSTASTVFVEDLKNKIISLCLMYVFIEMTKRGIFSLKSVKGEPFKSKSSISTAMIPVMIRLAFLFSVYVCETFLPEQFLMNSSGRVR